MLLFHTTSCSQNNMKAFPQLASIATAYLSFPRSAAQAERSFSLLGHIQSDDRLRTGCFRSEVVIGLSNQFKVFRDPPKGCERTEYSTPRLFLQHPGSICEMTPCKLLHSYISTRNFSHWNRSSDLKTVLRRYFMFH